MWPAESHSLPAGQSIHLSAPPLFVHEYSHVGLTGAILAFGLGDSMTGFSPMRVSGPENREFLHIWTSVCGKCKQRPADLLEISSDRHLRLTLLLAAGAAAGFGAGPETGGRSCSCRTGAGDPQRQSPRRRGGRPGACARPRGRAVTTPWPGAVSAPLTHIRPPAEAGTAARHHTPLPALKRQGP